MSIKWNKVTWYSKLAAVIVFVGTFALAFYLGQQFGGLNTYSDNSFRKLSTQQKTLVNVATFSCSNNKNILAAFYARSVNLKLGDGRTFNLSQTISASGARYANFDGSFVFWNKGNTAFIEEGATTTYPNCVTK